MRFNFKVVLTALFLSLFLFSSAAVAGIDEGRAAYQAKDWLSAIRHLRPLAEEGNAEALILLGNMYNDGKGVEQNHKVAFEHYKRALPSGNSVAMLAIATMYAKGLGVEKDFQAAFDWFLKSAEAGNPAAQVMVASFYLNGHAELKSLKPDIIKSYGWFRVVARQNEMPKMAALGKELAKRLTVQLTPDQILKGEKMADDYYAAHPAPAPKTGAESAPEPAPKKETEK